SDSCAADPGAAAYGDVVRSYGPSGRSGPLVSPLNVTVAPATMPPVALVQSRKSPRAASGIASGAMPQTIEARRRRRDLEIIVVIRRVRVACIQGKRRTLTLPSPCGYTGEGFG